MPRGRKPKQQTDESTQLKEVSQMVKEYNRNKMIEDILIIAGMGIAMGLFLSYVVYSIM